MSNKMFLVALLSVIGVGLAQRPGYAGSMPYGYPVIITTTAATTTAAAGNDLGNRFGADVTTTQRLPIEANGDISLVNYLSSLPQEQQPFWFLNWKAIEEHRKQPHTYPVRENGFIDFPRSSGF